jgi:hypothetical protein
MEFVANCQQLAEPKDCLPVAPVSDQMIFGAVNQSSAAPEKSPDPPQANKRSKRPGFPT